MDDKYLEQAKKELEEKHCVDALSDVILSRPKRLVCYALKQKDTNKTTLNLIAGNFKTIGFEDKPSITFGKILSCFDYNSKYSEVSGKKEYYDDIVERIHQYHSEIDVTLPIVNVNGRYWIRISTNAVHGNNDLVAVFITDVTQFLIKEEDLFLKTHRDSLTNLFNRYTLDYHYGKRYKFDNIHVLFLDLDNFKSANDRYGHARGNEYLQLFAKHLKDYENNYNRFYRIGGDEFVGLFFDEEKSIKKMATNILTFARNLNNTLSIDGTSVSIGILKGTSSDGLIQKTDKVLYKAKKLGKDRFVYEIEK